ncbi:unnamed protein product [Aphanomyces euteiches]|uniref:MARVEL domain-containing protein n=1 Tax=Aphanomyces euteiches TaxID=100861 RepID=A0A6G0WI65_9STRA|nr:hypothetical protein Ae201684_014901 [Aphanomyces euteiches]KAH9076715.1 hypothetical protein Ae201684P_010650 [Aphanomyces euteiches]KAH9153847.1 hypothetical protein AeRB84_003980 [Aphanomyces euteiches]
MSRKVFKRMAQVGLILRILQALCGAVILISLLTSYNSVFLADPANKGAISSDRYVPAKISHFFLAIVAYSSIVVGGVQLVFDELLGRIKMEPLLERCADIGLAVFFLVMGIVIAPQMDCSATSYINCTAFQVAVVFAFLNAVLFVISGVFNAKIKTVHRLNPDATENLVPRGRYGGEQAAAGAAPAGESPPKKVKKSKIDENDLELLSMPRGNFGSTRAMDLTEIKAYHEEYADEDVYFHSRVDPQPETKVKIQK